MLLRYLSARNEVVATARHTHSYVPDKNVTWRTFDAVGGDLAPIIDGADWIINAIGAIPQRCRDKDTMIEVNTHFPRRLAEIAEAKKIHVIQIATDCIYSGKRSLYDEYDYADPVDVYGTTKANGEIKSEYVHHLRCSIIGREPVGNYSLLSWFLSQPPDAVINGFTNHYWNGLTTLQFARLCGGIIDLLDTDELKTFQLPNFQHIVPTGFISKYELLRLFRFYFHRADITVNPFMTESKVNRTLATRFRETNKLIWAMAGYKDVPDIDRMILEYALYEGVDKKVGAYA